MAQGAVFGILQSTTQKAFAIYSEDDYSLTFYSDTKVPEEGSTYKNKSVTTVYTGFENESYSLGNSVPWNAIRSNVTSVAIHGSFVYVKPISTAYWFYTFQNSIEFSGFENLDTSKVAKMNYMFYYCTSLTSIDVSKWDMSNVTDMGSMFNSCSGLTSLDVSNWDTSNVTNMGSMFANCTSLTTIYSDDSRFVTTNVTSGSSMFIQCSNLVGGNGTAYSSSNVSYTMAHVDKAGNRGYFTQK